VRSPADKATLGASCAARARTNLPTVACDGCSPPRGAASVAKTRARPGQLRPRLRDARRARALAILAAGAVKERLRVAAASREMKTGVLLTGCVTGRTGRLRHSMLSPCAVEPAVCCAAARTRRRRRAGLPGAARASAGGRAASANASRRAAPLPCSCAARAAPAAPAPRRAGAAAAIITALRSACAAARPAYAPPRIRCAAAPFSARFARGCGCAVR
jgi:hypothetical protein